MPPRSRKNKKQKQLQRVTPPGIYSGVLNMTRLNDTFKQVFRFQNNTASQSRTNFVRAQMLGILCLNISTTVQYPVFGSVKIRKIRIVGTTIADTAGTAANNNIDLIWGGGMTGEEVTWSSSSNGMTNVAEIVSRPPPMTSASFVSSIAGVASSVAGTALGQGAEVLFSIVSQTGTYVELTCDCRFNDTPTTTSITVSGLTQGVVWWNPLDNQFLSGASHIYDPVGHRDFST
jgi:hypothetical protein